MDNYGFVKSAIATLNEGKLADPDINEKQMEKLINKAEIAGAKIIVFPELSITGYTCQDLFGFQKLLHDSNEAVKKLLTFSKKSDLLILIGAPVTVNDALYNCAIAIQNGNVLGIIPKQYLPNYGEFYEKRWFKPYTDFSKTTISFLGEEVPFGNLIFTSSLGYKLGVEICEDLWAVIPPSSYLSLAGANIIANLSSSNELVGKNEYRKELISNQSSRTIAGYLYVSTGFAESTSDVVFGGSGYIFENGKELASLKRYSIDDEIVYADIDIEAISNERRWNQTFSASQNKVEFNFTEIKFNQTFESLNAVGLSRKINPHPFVPSVDNNKRAQVCKEILSIQSSGLSKRLDSTGISTAVIDISGGLDSTLALIVTYEAFKKLGLSTSGILGITMPGFGTTKRTYGNSVNICKQMGISFKEIDIKKSCLQHFEDIGHDPKIHDITYENVQARERTQILMDIANKNGGLVIGTGDLSELEIGWCTYNGDHMSMYGVNCSIPKTLVKFIIEWYATDIRSKNVELSDTLLDIIDTPISPELLPTDGTEVTQKTEETVGKYELIDFFIYNMERKKFSGEKIIFLACKAFEGKYNQEEIMFRWNDFIIRHSRNQFKRNCLPDGPKVGTVSVSPRGDKRMPADVDLSIWQVFQKFDQ